MIFMIPIAKPNIGEEEKKAVLDVLSSGMLAQGKKVAEFEEKFALYVGAKYAIATNNGTTALHCMLLAHGIGPGDEVITSPFTFIASANAILYCGGKPVFVDIDEESYNIDPLLIEEKITDKTKAIMPVDLFGNPCDINKILEIAKKNNLVVLQDAAQAHGASVSGKKIGSFCTTSFSFYPTKNMTTGEGGIITTNDEQINDKARLIRDHGSKVRYYHDVLGYNYRMTDICAAIGIEQLKKIEGFNQKRIENASYMAQKLSDITFITTPKVRENTRHVFHQYTIRVPNRDKVISALLDNGIGHSVFYPVPVNEQKLYKEKGYISDTPVASKVAKEVLSIPIHPLVTNQDINKIAEVLTLCLN